MSSVKNIPLKLIEDHDEAYFFWKKLGIRGKSLIHLDAHIDFNFHAAKPPGQTLKEAKSKEDLIKQLSSNLFYKKINVNEKSLTNIGNYIYPAIRDGIVTDFYWIIPGDRREFKKSLKNLEKIARSFFPRDPFETRNLTKEKNTLKASIYGRNFIFTTLEDLPANMDGVLLDIDTDYLTTDTVRKAGASQDAGKRFPWIWPEELANRLREKNIKPSCITIAYSVNGGFTPIIYKFLGDEITVFLKGTANKKLKKIFLKKKNAFIAAKNGKTKESAEILISLLKKLEETKIKSDLKARLKAHIAFMLFRLHAEIKNTKKIRFYYNLAISADKTYTVKDNNYGYMYLREKRGVRKAEREFKNILLAEGNNSYALSGLADIFMKQKKIKAAKKLFKKAYTANGKNRAALLGLGQSEILSKNYNKALQYLEDYGAKNKIRSATVHLMKALCYQGLCMFDEALAECQRALAFGTNPDLYLRIFRLLRKIDVPEEKSDWIKKTIGEYGDWRKNFLKNQKKHSDYAPRTKQIKKLIDRIDNALGKIAGRYG